MATIYPRNNVYWIAYKDPRTGKRIQKSTHIKKGTLTKAQERELIKAYTARVELEIIEGRINLPSSRPAIEIVPEYEKYATGRKTKKSLDLELSMIKVFLDRTMPGPISAITKKHVQDFLQTLIEAQKSPRTVNYYLTAIRALLKYAVDQGLIPADPTAGIRPLRLTRKPPRFLSTDEIRELLKAADGQDLYRSIIVALYTGMRVSEIIRLRWEDFDWDAGTVIVKQAKSGAFRVIPLPGILKTLLEPFKQESGHVAHYNGEINYNGQPQKDLDSIMEKAKITDACWHTLRKTFASHHIMNGTSITKVAKWLGHSTPTITYQTYAHLAPVQDKDADRLSY